VLTDRSPFRATLLASACSRRKSFQPSPCWQRGRGKCVWASGTRPERGPRGLGRRVGLEDSAGVWASRTRPECGPRSVGLGDSAGVWASECGPRGSRPECGPRGVGRSVGVGGVGRSVGLGVGRSVGGDSAGVWASETRPEWASGTRPECGPRSVGLGSRFAPLSLRLFSHTRRKAATLGA
jgi:hypothetical protein